MNKELEEFINLKDERKNSAYAKLKLRLFNPYIWASFFVGVPLLVV